jgi:integrase/recombinase XerD
VEVVRAWVYVRGSEPGALPPRRRNGHRVERRRTEEAIIYSVLRRSGEVGIQSLTPHDFRRTFATNLLESNIDLGTCGPDGALGHQHHRWLEPPQRGRQA